MRRWKIWLAALIVFLSGVTIGGAATVIAGRKMMLNLAAQGPAGTRTLVMRKLNWHLDLSPEQSQALEREVARVQLVVFQLRRENSAKVHAALEEGVARMSTQLKEGQRRELTRLYQQFLERITPKEEWKKELAAAAGE